MIGPRPLPGTKDLSELKDSYRLKIVGEYKMTGTLKSPTVKTRGDKKKRRTKSRTGGSDTIM